ncbi:MAG: thioredoxin [Flavobacteriaceae bacterium]|nr:thioredoxin [Flavobacteriaceae bacterium]
MNIKIVLLLLAIIFTACKNENSTETEQAETPTEAISETTPEQTPAVLVGPIRFETLQKTPYKDLFVFEAVTFNEDQVALLKPLSKDVHFTVALGSWCEDSQFLIPRFYALTKALSIDESAIELVAVDEEKITPEAFIKENDIAYVPTIIVQKNNNELGRIVELTIEDLASDLLKILSGEDYKHTYQE